MSTHYEILQVSETASSDIIKQRFQQLILEVMSFFLLLKMNLSKTKFHVASS